MKIGNFTDMRTEWKPTFQKVGSAKCHVVTVLHMSDPGDNDV